MSLLDVQNLTVEFGRFRAVDDLSFAVQPGEILGIVGESGSGKSVTQLALMGLIDEPGRVRADRLEFDGKDLLKTLYAEAIAHRGFSVVDTLQVCVTFRNLYEYYNERVYELEGHDPRDEAQAIAKIREWDYRSDGPVALGTLSVRDRPVFGDQFAGYGRREIDRDAELKAAFAELT